MRTCIRLLYAEHGVSARSRVCGTPAAALVSSLLFLLVNISAKQRKSPYLQSLQAAGAIHAALAKAPLKHVSTKTGQVEPLICCASLVVLKATEGRFC